MWGALIGAGASLIGSLFGGGSKKQTTTNTVDYVKMVRNAERAGFNPLTALRNGGAAGFTTSTTGATPFSARLADGVAGAAQNFFANFDPFADRRQEMEARLVEAQIANLGASTAQMNRVGLGSVPTYTAGQQKRKFGATVPKGASHIDLAKTAGAAIAQQAVYPGQGDGGKILPLYTHWRDLDGSLVRLPNADLPDIEQMPVPATGAASTGVDDWLKTHSGTRILCRGRHSTGRGIGGTRLSGRPVIGIRLRREAGSAEIRKGGTRLGRRCRRI